MNLKALIFDVDGTLAETEGVHLAAFNAAFEDFGLDWHWSHETYLELLKTTGGKERMAAYHRQFLGLDDEKFLAIIPQIHAHKTEHYKRLIRAGAVDLRPGVQAVMDNGKAAGLRLAIATTTTRANVEALCQSVWGKELEDVFELAACGDEVAHKKPAPDVFLLALERLGLRAENCLAFEDSVNGLKSANAAGLRTIITPSIYGLETEFDGAEQVWPTLEGFDLPSILS